MTARQNVITGSWKLVSFTVVDEATREEVQPWGPHPQGRMIFSPSGYMSATLNPEQAPPPTDDRAAALRSALAYTGAYRIEGNTFITSVDAGAQGWIGTEQKRDFTIDGDTLTITTASNTNADGKTRHGIIVWRREQAE